MRLTLKNNRSLTVDSVLYNSFNETTIESVRYNQYFSCKSGAIVTTLRFEIECGAFLKNLDFFRKGTTFPKELHKHVRVVNNDLLYLVSDVETQSDSVIIKMSTIENKRTVRDNKV